MRRSKWGLNIMKVRFFFFSSRRRHTRYWRDWSSDVCSSDLVAPLVAVLQALELRRVEVQRERVATRSEERRVGKECRSRWCLNRTKKRRPYTGGRLGR